MLNQIIDILTSYSKPKKVCVMGNIAIARGAIEAEVCGVFSYPGTPSTEISEVFNFVNEFQNKNINQNNYPHQTKHKIYFEYSINEKIALEKAIAFSIGNKSAMCVMKNVGMNVACDALMSITYQTIVAPLVIVVCDDPGCHSSSNEQDSRYWGQIASVPVFNPSTPSEAIDMTRQAFKLSAEIKLPVIVRTTTRVSHSRGIISFGNIQYENRLPEFARLPEHINIPARTTAAHSKLLDKLKQKVVLGLLEANSRIVEENIAEVGIICSGVSTAYLIEILHQYHLENKVNVLSLGMIHPFPEKEVLCFLKKDIKKVLILEELEPMVENAVRVLAQKNRIHHEIFGKDFSGLTKAGEYSIDMITRVLEEFLQITFIERGNIPVDHAESFMQHLPPRPPTLCAGCPHRATFYLLKLAIPREQSELILCGDIGCFGLGALPPLKMIDTINHMGMSISMAQGLYESFNSSREGKKVVALVGDGTFFHSGLASLVNAVYTRANILVVIFDNRTIGMTGHQSHPGASQHMAKYHEIDIPPLLKGLGIEVVENINPFDLRDGIEKLNKAMAHEGVSVVVSKAPCIFLPDFKEKVDHKMKIVVDATLCNACGNHEDISLSCSRCYSPKNNLSRAKAKLLAEISIPADEQLCPANICNHGFFNSVLEGDYKSAVEIVRDKMLFARTCGDICHRPCELFSVEEKVVPIKSLKKFVSSIDENFHDFSFPISRVKNALKKNKSVAIIGAGPAGLSAAYDLVQAGYDVSVFEKENKAGGMVTYAIPDFRMDKKGFDYEALQLKEMGVLFHFNTSVGNELSLKKLSDEFDAVILAAGLHKSKALDVIEKNVPSRKRTDALAFLKSFNLKENQIENPLNVLVVGGGNSAIDAARSAKKLNPKNRIIVSCIETEDAMPAFEEEVKHAVEEGVEIIHDSYLASISAANDDEFNIILHSYSNKNFIQPIQCNYFITAIGQTAEPHIIKNFPVDKDSRIKGTHDLNGYKNVFVAGDLSSGNNMSVIGAIASGKKAAVSVRQLLENYQFEYEGTKALDRLNENSSVKGRAIKPIIDEILREEIERFNLFQSCMKCNHCIDNFGCPALIKVNGKVKIDESRCTLCGLCIDVCPNNAIRWEEERFSLRNENVAN